MDNNDKNSTKGFETEDPVDWKKLGTLSSEPAPIKRRRRIRQIPDYYFLPRRSLPSAIAFYGAFVVAGLGAGMLVQKWIEEKVAVHKEGNEVLFPPIWSLKLMSSSNLFRGPYIEQIKGMVVRGWRNSSNVSLYPWIFNRTEALFGRCQVAKVLVNSFARIALFIDSFKRIEALSWLKFLSQYVLYSQLAY